MTEEAGTDNAGENMLFLSPLKTGASNESIVKNGRAEPNTKPELIQRNGIFAVVGRELLTSRKSVLQSLDDYYTAPSTAIHETLHQYGLSDRYKGKNGLVATPAAYKHDIMGEGYGKVEFSQTHFDNLGSKLLELSNIKKSDNFNCCCRFRSEWKIERSIILVMQKAIIFFTLLIVISSCNYKLLVSKNRIYTKRTGYLIFFASQKYFFPAKHIDGNHFFTTKINNPGYLVSFDRGEAALYYAAEKYTIDYEYLYHGEMIFVRDTVRILPVEIGSIPYENQLKSKKVLQDDLIIKYDNKIKRLRYYGTNNESVWTVYSILEEDGKEEEQYYNKYGPGVPGMR
ncbi:hypothetical protein [Chitinophaga sp. CF118]|uniref:hypothetical protein n=1 Tax=Chitinophaga sp. CF118 TaxID=1884367 RepID=UPI000B7E71C3|nr:hypothetical protein [Chitinophaga sp. CF118]